jgi:TRAP-type uncharacterized transport system substrate-binding protein
MVKIFVNGVKEAETTFVGNSIQSKAIKVVTIGAGGDNGIYYFFNGKIYD